ncbi:hypothetical protein ASPBRDRAFT_627382 [Aspergillus brasiliensis CBS 101740]|uniref:Uncharacterized protein n=1 Tax=Aspergillus brasiliensis (strain CBS 101740 / IMI 381727 / IBT 21946) TaxID=767769 RepID=A0A1L9UG03_ASPBC|nr:hypothetical protein ASPBRDRAFT_627382 [Aspergillus brasiliensis CBS 101740]
MHAALKKKSLLLVIHRARATSNIRSQGKEGNTGAWYCSQELMVLRGVSSWNTVLGCLFNVIFTILAHILLSRDEHILQNLPARAELSASAFLSPICDCLSLLTSVH